MGEGGLPTALWVIVAVAMVGVFSIIGMILFKVMGAIF